MRSRRLCSEFAVAARRRVRGCASLVAVVACLAASAAGGLPPFPGAEGFGATSVGGRGGRVIKVTNLNPSGPGSLQAACAAQGPRIVVFDVGGVIRGDVFIRHSSITIAGQTAPPPGITIEGRLLARPEPWTRLEDIVVRFLRVRPPPAKGHDGDALQMPDTERVMLDHLSLAWANDETVDIIHASDVTLQWSTLEESDVEGHAKGRGHNFGLISAYPRSGNISIHHNLFAHHSRRSPSLSPYVPGKPGDFRNNVVYNFHEGSTHDGHVPREAINLIGNYYKRGPDSAEIAPFEFHPEGRYFLAGNLVDGVDRLDDVLAARTTGPPWLVIKRRGRLLEAAAPVAAVTTLAAADAYREVLALAGSLPRDRVTLRTVGEVRRGTGAWGRNAPAAPDDAWYLAGLARGGSPPDGDGDGMPDAWEDAHGLDKRDGGDHARLLASGYTAIETYINEKAAQLIDARMHDRDEDRIVVLGASYAGGWPVQELRGRRVVNHGVAGEQTGQMLARFERDVVAARPRAVILWGFINDIHRAPSDGVEKALESARASIAEMVRLARAHAIEPMLATEVTIRERDDLVSLLAGWWGRLRGKRSYQDVVNGHVLETNRWLRTFAAQNDVALLDFQPQLADASGERKREFATKDGSHIPQAAYARLTAYAEDALARVLDR